jgi:acetylornithine deacetylase/succinyl-diaminopimelate desuccinylase-like protein
MDPIIADLWHDPRIRAARRHIERADEVTLARQIELSTLAAPTGAEARRAARVAELFREAGLHDVTIDGAGNVLGWVVGEGGRGKGEGYDGAPVILSAHLDTVFGAEVDVRVERRDGRLQGPGISDNARGLAALITVAQALVRERVPLARPVLFAATVGEEGLGNLRGARYLLDGTREAGSGKRPRPTAFIALDGAGIERVVHRALGSRRYRATYRGPGGHSWAAFGIANPAAAVGRAAAAVTELPTPSDPRTTCAVVRLGGGTALNSIPAEAWLELDLRSETAAALADIDRAVGAALERARDAENARRTRGTPPLTLTLDLLGERPPGRTAPDEPLVQAAVAATRALGRDCELASASTDANAAIALGIPAIALGAGGRGGDAHLTSEWYENTNGALGVVRAMLVAVAMARSGGSQYR